MGLASKCRKPGRNGTWPERAVIAAFNPEQKSAIKIVRISGTGASLESGVRLEPLSGAPLRRSKPLGGVTSVN
jgi:hypothetical protein